MARSRLPLPVFFGEHQLGLFVGRTRASLIMRRQGAGLEEPFDKLRASRLAYVGEDKSNACPTGCLRQAQAGKASRLRIQR